MTDIPVLDLTGSGKTRGREHGEKLRREIGEFRRHWRADIERVCMVSAEHFVERFVEETDFLPDIKHWTPDLLAEVEGIAEGANIPFRDCLAIQCMDEQWWFAEAFRGRHHCSSVAQFDPASGETLVAQNMDLPCWMDGSQIVMRIRDADGRVTLLLSASGMVGLCGVAADGLALCVNTLAQLPHSHIGLPVAFVIRRLLQCNDLIEARQLVHSLHHASGQNYLLGHRSGIADFECSAAGVTEVLATSDVILHTNHALACGGNGSDSAASISGEINSRRRMAAIKRKAEGRTFEPNFVAGLLSDREDADHPIAIAKSDPHPFFTFGSVILQLQDSYKAIIGFGAPSLAAAKHFNLASM